MSKPTKAYYKAGEPCPCDTCPNRSGCKINEIGCEDYARYASVGIVENRGEDYRMPARKHLKLPDGYRAKQKRIRA